MVNNKVADAFLADRCLNPGGLLAFHDAFMFSVSAAVKYLAKERGYEVIKLMPDCRLKRWLRCMNMDLSMDGMHIKWCLAQPVVSLHCENLWKFRSRISINNSKFIGLFTRFLSDRNAGPCPRAVCQRFCSDFGFAGSNWAGYNFIVILF